MKILITEGQLKNILLNEQGPMGLYGSQMFPGVKPGEVAITIKKMYEMYPHEINMVFGVATAFIPLVGPAISAGISLMDAKMYYDEGDKKTAGMVAMFSLLPGAGVIISKIPGVKQLGSKGMSLLAKKFVKGGKMSQLEVDVIIGIISNAKLVKQEAQKQATSLSSKILSGTKKLAVAGVKTIAPYAAAGVTYNKVYDKLNPEENMNLDIDVNKISDINKKAAASLKFD